MEGYRGWGGALTEFAILVSDLLETKGTDLTVQDIILSDDWLDQHLDILKYQWRALCKTCEGRVIWNMSEIGNWRTLPMPQFLVMPAPPALTIESILRAAFSVRSPGKNQEWPKHSPCGKSPTQAISMQLNEPPKVLALDLEQFEVKGPSTPTELAFDAFILEGDRGSHWKYHYQWIATLCREPGENIATRKWVLNTLAESHEPEMSYWRWNVNDDEPGMLQIASGSDPNNKMPSEHKSWSRLILLEFVKKENWREAFEQASKEAEEANPVLKYPPVKRRPPLELSHLARDKHPVESMPDEVWTATAENIRHNGERFKRPHLNAARNQWATQVTLPLHQRPSLSDNSSQRSDPSASITPSAIASRGVLGRMENDHTSTPDQPFFFDYTGDPSLRP